MSGPIDVTSTRARARMGMMENRGRKFATLFLNIMGTATEMRIRPSTPT